MSRVLATSVRHTRNAITHDYKRSRRTMCAIMFRWHILNGVRKGKRDPTSAHWPPAKKRRARTCGSYFLFTRIMHTYASEYSIRSNALVPLLRVINSGPLGDAPSVRGDIPADCGLFSERTLSPHIASAASWYVIRQRRGCTQIIYYADVNRHARGLT